MLALLKELGPKLELRAGAETSAIAEAQKALAWTFPEVHVVFLRTSNSAVGMLASGDCVDLWPVEQLSELNSSYQFPEYYLEVVAFGSGGGGEAFVFRRSNAHIAIVPFIGMAIDEAVDIAPAFTGFLRRPRPAGWE